MSSIYGKLFQISTFGESHGPAVGVIVQGCPSGINFDLDFVQSELDRRKPGQSRITTQRKEIQRKPRHGSAPDATTNRPSNQVLGQILRKKR